MPLLRQALPDRVGWKCDIFTDYGYVSIEILLRTQDATFLYGGVAADYGTIDGDLMLNVGEAHDHAIADLNVALDQAGMADMRVLDDHASLNAAVPADGDIPLQ